MTSATIQKRKQLTDFVRRKLAPNDAVQAVLGIGSLATGTAHPGSDSDAVLFLEPMDLYIVPAEAIWREADDTFHSIFAEDPDLQENGLQLDFKRLDWRVWKEPSHEWPEPMRAELASAWVAYDRSSEVSHLVRERTTYDEESRLARLDEAITWLDQHLGDDGPRHRWETLGPLIAHDRLHAAYDYLVQALFAGNRRWRVWRNREMMALLQLPWLPRHFEKQALSALNARTHDHTGYQERVRVLQDLFHDVLHQLTAEGTYGADPVGEAFVRRHDEPGRAWNMDDWNREHRKRRV